MCRREWRIVSAVTGVGRFWEALGGSESRDDKQILNLKFKSWDEFGVRFDCADKAVIWAPLVPHSGSTIAFS